MKISKKILIVDDEILVIDVLTKKLKKEGFLVDSAFDGVEALLKVDKLKPDLILLDIIMPKLDGISVLKKLKASDETKDIAIIILTNLYDDQKIAEALEAGNTDYLIKVDYTVNEIVRKVKEKLGYRYEKNLDR